MARFSDISVLLIWAVAWLLITLFNAALQPATSPPTPWSPISLLTVVICLVALILILVGASGYSLKN